MVLAACGSSGKSDPQTGDDQEQAVPGELLVGVRAGKVGDAALEAKIAKVGTILSSEARVGFYRIKLPDGASQADAEAKLRDADILYVEPNYLAHPCAAPNDALWATPQFGGFHGNVQSQILAAWAAFVADGTVTSSAPIKVAVVDTGVKGDHEDLVNKTGAGRNVLAGGSAISAGADSDYGTGHGTQVAGVIAAEINNTKGIAGIAASDVSGADPQLVQIIPVKIGDATTPPNHATLAAGIAWAAANADIIVVAMDSASPSWTLQNAVQGAWVTDGTQAGSRLIIAPAGNRGTSVMRYPAAYGASNQGVLSVASVDGNDKLSTTSTYGSWVNLLAPGENIITTSNASTSSYTDLSPVSGASFSAAFTAGAAALIKAAYPALNASQLRSVLIASVDSYDRSGANNISSGGGRLNVARALSTAGLVSGAPTTAQLASVTFSATKVKGGQQLDGTVTFTKAVSAPTTVTLANGGASAATVPANVTVATGARTATFKLSSIAVDTTDPYVTITATSGGVSVTQEVQVVHPVVKSITFNPSSLTAGSSSTATITLDGPAPTGGLVVTFTSGDTTHVPAPANATIAAGQSTKTVTFATSNATPITATTPVAITAKANGSSDTAASATLTLKTLAGSLTLSATKVKGGTNVTGTVTLTSPATTGGQTVTLASADATVCTVPASITIAAGASSGSFTVTTIPQAADSASITLTATINSIALTAGVTVQAPAVKSVAFNPTIVMNGVNSTGTVTLDGPAPTGGLSVALASSDETVGVPSTATVAGGATSATFTASPVAVLSDVTASITATYNGASKAATLTVRPELANFALSTLSIAGGSSLTGTITLNANAPTGGVSVALAVASGLAAQVTITEGSSVTVAAGTKTATIHLTTTASTSDISGAITATVSGVTKTVTLKVAEPQVSKIALSSPSVMGGIAVTGTITLTAPAPAGYAVTLASSNTTVANPSATVSFSTGATTATFSFTPTGVASTTQVTLTASANGTNKTTTLSVVPTIIGLSLSPTSLSLGGTNTSTATVTIATPAPTGGLTVNVASSDATKATVSGATVVIAAGATSATFTVTGVAAGTANVTASLNTSTQSATVTVGP